jgi:DNA-binding MarR family transcriptional regulator
MQSADNSLLDVAVSSDSHERHTRRILTELEAGHDISQRSLAERLGIALGLTNLLMRRVVRKGWVRVVHIRPNRVRYLLTPAGIAEKSRMTRKYLSASFSFYAEARDRIRTRLDELSADWDSVSNDCPSGGGIKRIVFFGGGEVSEVGYVCLQGTDLTLVAVVDDKVQHFFGVPVCGYQELGPVAVAGRPYDRVVVMSFENLAKIRKQLARRGVPPERVFWV